MTEKRREPYARERVLVAKFAELFPLPPGGADALILLLGEYGDERAEALMTTRKARK